MLWVSLQRFIMHATDANRTIFCARIHSRWDTHGHPLADFSGRDPESELFPGINRSQLNYVNWMNTD